MSRARGANAVMNFAFNTAAYGAIPAATGYYKVPFVTSNLGEEQGLNASDLLGFGRAPLPPSRDVINNVGDVVIPLDLRYFWLWLKGLFGAPTTTQGVAASGTYVFSAQPTNLATITVGGQAFTFKTSPAGATDIQIGATLADTVANAVLVLNASTVAGVLVASYAADLAGTTITITYDVVGTGGNAMTIVAGSSPASNATASGATLAGGATTGPYNHVFVSGGLSLPDAAIEVGLPDVPSYGMNFGAVINSLMIALQRSGNLTATVNVIAQGENRSGSSGAGSPTSLVIERFSQFSGAIVRDGVPIADAVSGNLSFMNGLDTVDVIRPDGRIGGVDSGQESVKLDIVARFRDNTFFALATNNTPVEIVLNWSIAPGKSLQIKLHYMFLPKPKLPITGPKGVQSTFSCQAAIHPTLNRTVTATLVNDVAAY